MQGLSEKTGENSQAAGEGGENTFAKSQEEW